MATEMIYKEDSLAWGGSVAHQDLGIDRLLKHHTNAFTFPIRLPHPQWP